MQQLTIELTRRDTKRKIAEAKVRLMENLTEAGLERWEEIDCYAEITQSSGKGSNFVSPAALRKALKEDKEFYDCVSVSITKAKKYLAGKALAAITSFTPGKPGPREVIVSRKEVKE